MFYCSEPFYLYDHHILTDIFSDLSLQVSTSLQVTCLQPEWKSDWIYRVFFHWILIHGTHTMAFSFCDWTTILI